MVYGETLRGFEFQSNTGAVFRCFIGESGVITFQIFRGTDGVEAVFEGNDKKEFSKLLFLLVKWIGVEDAKKIIEKMQKRGD